MSFCLSRKLRNSPIRECYLGGVFRPTNICTIYFVTYHPRPHKLYLPDYARPGHPSSLESCEPPFTHRSPFVALFPTEYGEENADGEITVLGSASQVAQLRRKKARSTTSKPCFVPSTSEAAVRDAALFPVRNARMSRRYLQYRVDPRGASPFPVPYSG